MAAEGPLLKGDAEGASLCSCRGNGLVNKFCCSFILPTVGKMIRWPELLVCYHDSLFEFHLEIVMEIHIERDVQIYKQWAHPVSMHRVRRVNQLHNKHHLPALTDAA